LASEVVGVGANLRHSDPTVVAVDFGAEVGVVSVVADADEDFVAVAAAVVS